ITSWLNRYEAFSEVAKSISTTIKVLQKRRVIKQSVEQGMFFASRKEYEKALKAFEKAIQLNPVTVLNPQFLLAYYHAGYKLDNPDHETILQAYEHSLHLHPHKALAYVGKSHALFRLQRYEEVLSATEQALYLDSRLALAYVRKGDALRNLKRLEEALIA